jgi:hypothetical protein
MSVGSTSYGVSSYCFESAGVTVGRSRQQGYPSHSSGEGDSLFHNQPFFGAPLRLANKLFKKRQGILYSRPATFYPPNVPQIKLSQSSVVQWEIKFGNSDAGGLNRKAVLPDSLDVSAAYVKLLRQNQSLVCVVYAEGRDGIALHPPLRGSQANISSVKMKMGK